MPVVENPEASRRTLALRALVIVLLSSWFWYGPIRGQWMGIKKAPLRWSWALFKHGARDTCDLRYFERVEGQDLPVNRAELFEYEASYLMPRHLRVVQREQLDAHHQQVCRRLRRARGTRVDLRGDIRCALKPGWDVVEQRERNLCVRLPPETPLREAGTAK